MSRIVDQAMQFLERYRFPLASIGVLSLRDTELAVHLRSGYGATDRDSVLHFSRLQSVPPMRVFEL